MNAKKIMGAVLVALLAAALFVGAGAADNVDKGVVTTYTDLSAEMLGDGTTAISAGLTFTTEDGKFSVTTVTSDNTNVYFAESGDALNKKYSGYGITFTLVAPNAPVAALNGVVNVIGSTVSKEVAEALTFTANFGGAVSNFVFINEAGVKYNGDNAATGITFAPGKWGVAANLTGNTGLVDQTIPMIGQFYYFTVAKTEASLSAVADVVNKGEKIVLNIQYPGKDEAVVFFNSDYAGYIDDQFGVTEDANGKYVVVSLGLDGTGSVAFDAKDKGKAKFTLGFLEAGVAKETSGVPKVTVDIKLGEITATADEDSFFTGNAIALSGTTTAGSDLFFYIEGQNFAFTQISSEKSRFPDFFATNGDLEVANGAWTAKFASSEIVSSDVVPKKLIAGTYTIVVSTCDYAANEGQLKADNPDMTMKEIVMDATYGTAAVTLTQPFIENIKAGKTAIQDLEYEITGTAYSAEHINYYIFGNNYFLAGAADVDTDEETFEITLKALQTKGMAPGTYFYLIQHPMGDTLFNVWNNQTEPGLTAADTNPFTASYADFFYAATGDASQTSTFIFNAYERGTNYAAQALLEEIGGQNIDDIFVQGTFEVAAQKLSINPIPAEVVKGTALTVSGTSNSGEGTEVIVNVIEGTFGATIKGDENAATFLTEKAVTKADGTWEAAIDTSKLKVGTAYTVTVELNGVMYDSEAVKIVAPADTPDQPDTPVDPVDPVDPVTPPTETPGFGALAALAGLGAVAVLLLRRE